MNQIVMEYLSKHPLSWQAKYMTKLVFGYIEKFGELNRDNVDDFRCWLLKKVSKTSVNSYIKTAKPVYAWAVRTGRLKRDPFANIKLYRVKREEIIIFETDEIQNILNKLNEENNIRLTAAVIVGLDSGLRLSEILNLTIKDIDFANGKICVRAKADNKQTWQWQPKNGNNRQVPLTRAAENAITRLLLNVIHPYLFLTEKRYFSLINSKPTERQRKKPSDSISRQFTKLCHQCGIYGKTFHNLRKSCLTRWAENLQTQKVKTLAGHSAIETTLKYYVKVNEQRCVDEARSIGAAGFDPATS